MAFDFFSRQVNQSAIRSLRRRGSRLDRFKLTAKGRIRETLLADPAVEKAVSRYAREQATTPDAAWSLVERYIDEIVPFFNSRVLPVRIFLHRGLLTGLPFIRRSDEERAKALPRDAIVVY